MHIESKKKAYFIAGILFNVCVLIVYINGEYPIIGEDYRYFISRMIDVIAHYKYNGLSIQWFTPTFGGGLPAFSNPQHTQFFIPQFFSLYMNPWLAILISIAIVTLVGYYCCYKFITTTLDFDWKVGIIGSIFFMSNGFYIQHLAAGHLTFLPFPLIILAFYLIFSKKAVLQNGLALGIVLAGILFSGGVHILIIFALAYIITVPLIVLMHPSKINLKNTIYISLIGLLTSLLLSSGKLYATYSFVSNFPRDYFNNDLLFMSGSYLIEFIGFFFQFIGVRLLIFPFQYLHFENISIGDFHRYLVNSDYYLWEIDVSIPYPQIAFLYSGVRYIFLKIINTIKKNPRTLKKKILLILFLLISVWFTIEFTAGYGILFNATKEFPIINTITVRSRYAAAFLFPILILCLKPLENFFNNTVNHKKRRFRYIYLITLCSFLIYFLAPYKLQRRNINIDTAMDSYLYVKNNENIQITKIGNVEEILAIPEGTSSQFPCEGIFGYALETFKAETIEGPIILTDGEHYNMTNPYYLVYSDDHSFRRFTKDQYQMMETFASYKQPDWDIPTIQIVLIMIGVITLILILAYFIYFLFKRFIPHVKDNLDKSI